MQNQCVGLAEALGAIPAIKHVRLRAPWRQLFPHVLRWGCGYAMTADSDPIEPPWPDVLIASGRHSVAASLLVGQRNPATFRVQIQSPGLPASLFDLLVVPRHDRLRGANVLVSQGALHRVTPQRLAADAERWRPSLEWLPTPRVAVLIGGSNGSYRLTPSAAAELGDSLVRMARRQNLGLMVTASRRTDPQALDQLRQRLDRPDVPAVFWDGTGDNPYFAYLGLADAVIVTADSVSMTSEACATGKPVHVVHLEGGSKKFEAFHQSLVRDGITRPFQGTLEHWSYPPLDDTARAAEWIQAARKDANAIKFVTERGETPPPPRPWTAR
jgi:mitochondrial fission protein ELM1